MFFFSWTIFHSEIVFDFFVFFLSREMFNNLYTLKHTFTIHIHVKISDIYIHIYIFCGPIEKHILLRVTLCGGFHCLFGAIVLFLRPIQKRDDNTSPRTKTAYLRPSPFCLRIRRSRGNTEDHTWTPPKLNFTYGPSHCFKTRIRIYNICDYMQSTIYWIL